MQYVENRLTKAGKKLMDKAVEKLESKIHKKPDISIDRKTPGFISKDQVASICRSAVNEVKDSITTAYLCDKDKEEVKRKFKYAVTDINNQFFGFLRSFSAFTIPAKYRDDLCELVRMEMVQMISCDVKMNKDNTKISNPDWTVDIKFDEETQRQLQTQMKTWWIYYNILPQVQAAENLADKKEIIRAVYHGKSLEDGSIIIYDDLHEIAKSACMMFVSNVLTQEQLTAEWEEKEIEEENVIEDEAMDPYYFVSSLGFSLRITSVKELFLANTLFEAESSVYACAIYLLPSLQSIRDNEDVEPLRVYGNPFARRRMKKAFLKHVVKLYSAPSNESVVSST